LTAERGSERRSKLPSSNGEKRTEALPGRGEERSAVGLLPSSVRRPVAEQDRARVVASCDQARAVPLPCV